MYVSSSVLSSKMLSFALVVAAAIIFQVIEDSGGSDCEILKDLPPSITVYESKSAELCVFTTSQCEDGIVYWNNIPYYHGRPANRTPDAGGVVVFEYALKPGETTITENGSSVQFVLLGVNGSVFSEVAVILIANNVSALPPPPAVKISTPGIIGDSIAIAVIVMNIHVLVILLGVCIFSLRSYYRKKVSLAGPDLTVETGFEIENENMYSMVNIKPRQPVHEHLVQQPISSPPSECTVTYSERTAKQVGINTSEITIPKEITALQSVLGHTDVPTLKTLLIELKEVSEWFQLGVLMGIKGHKLKEIKQSNGEVADYKLKLFEFWLDTAESPTWEAIARAVRELNPNLAKKLEKDHLQKPQAEGGAIARVDTKNSLIKRLRALELSFSHMIANVKKLLVDCDPTDARCFLSVLLVTDEFSDCDTMEKILFQLCQNYADRFNVEHLKESLSRFKREDVNSLIEAYEQESDQFMETTTVLEFLQEVSDTAELAVRQGKASIAITVSRKFARDMTLKSVQTLAKNWFDDNHTSFINFNVVPRSIVITWFFPKRLTAKLQQLAVTNAAVFCQQGVYEVNVAGKSCIEATQQ